MNENTTGAESWIVAGEGAPPEDARISGAFGPARETAKGIDIPVLRSSPGSGPPVPVGVLRVAGGRVTFHSTASPDRRAAQGVLFFWTLVWIAWLWRRRRSYE